MAKIKILDHNSNPHEIELCLETLNVAEAAGAAHAVRHFDNTVFTGNNPNASAQIYAAMGFTRPDVTVRQLQEGAAADTSRFEAASVSDGSVTGRLVMAAYLMDSIENKLKSTDDGINALFLKKAAINESINDTRFDRPVIDFSAPEDRRSKAIAQLSEPASNVLITASDKSYKIAGRSIGIEYSDQVAQNIKLNIVALSMQRQAEKEYAEDIQYKYKSFLDGDTDLDMPALTPVLVNTLDSSISSAGKLTQLAWVKWLNSNGTIRKIDTIICNLKTAMAIEGRTGRPTVQGDNAKSKRIDVVENIMNPTWPTGIDIILNEDFDDNFILGFDSTYGYHNVSSTNLSYQAVEQFSIRRSTKLRVDFGSISYRLFDDAWSCLKLATS